MPLAPTIASALTVPVLSPEREPARYRIQVFQFADSEEFGIGPLVADLANVKNIGWADYANDVPGAFFTLNQDDEHTLALSSVLGRSHVRILRDDKVVWAGWLMESDETADDIVFYAYGYLAGLFWALTDWKYTMASQPVSAIVHSLWYRASREIAQSMLAWVPVGTVEGAQNGTDGAGEIVLQSYVAYYKRVLYAMQELAALGMSDTSNSVLFEVTHSETPQFNWHHNRGVRRDDVRWSFGDGIIRSFRRNRMPVFTRTDVKAVGSLASQVVARSEVEQAAAINTYGRRQEPMFLAWVRDQTELDRVTRLRFSTAVREENDLTLRLFPNSVVPPGGKGAKFRIGDSIWIDIERGATVIRGFFRVVGFQVIFAGGEEHLNVHLQTTPDWLPVPSGARTTVTDDTKYNAFVGATRMADGRLLAAYYKATDHATTLDGIIAGKTSADDGKTWSSEFTLYAPPGLDARDPELTTLRDGSVMLIARTWDGASGLRQYAIKSTDNAATWGTPQEIVTSLTAVASVSRAVELPNDDLVVAVYGNNGTAYNSCLVLRSTDGGVTWGDEQVVAAGNASFDATEPYIGLLKDNTLLCLIRENTPTAGGVYMSRSTDYGKTWSIPALVVPSVRSKPAFVQTTTGALLLVVRGTSVSNIYYRSADAGRSFSSVAETLDPAGTTGNYASLIPTEDGGAIVIYGVERSSTKSDVRCDRFVMVPA